MKTYLRLMSDRQTTVVTVPDLDFNSLHHRNVRQLNRLFHHAAERVVGTTVILDVTLVKTGGAGFLTAVHRLATDLAEKHTQLVIAGDVGGLFRLVGWERRFPLFDSLAAAVIALADRRLAGDPVQPAPRRKSGRTPNPKTAVPPESPRCGCLN